MNSSAEGRVVAERKESVTMYMMGNITSARIKSATSWSSNCFHRGRSRPPTSREVLMFKKRTIGLLFFVVFDAFVHFVVHVFRRIWNGTLFTIPTNSDENR